MQVVSDQDILYENDIMCPDTILRVARLCLLSRLNEKAPMVLMSMILDLAVCNVGWPKQVTEDLKWLCSSSVYSAASSRSFSEWAEYTKGNGKYFRGQVKKYAKLRYADTYCSKSFTITPGVNSQACTIDGCRFVCDSRQKMGLHVFKVHGIKSVWKQYVGNLLFCPICLKYFHTRERVLNHVRYRSEICRHNMVLRDLKWSVSEIDAMDADDLSSHVEAQKSGKRRHAVESQVVQLEGPLEPILLIGKGSSHHPLGIGHNLRNSM